MSAIVKRSGKRGLLIGINSYPNLVSKDLDGCINDVSAMNELLRDNFGFRNEDLTVLKDDEATHDGILDAFDSLIRNAEKGDIVVIQFSGHGSQMRASPDRNKANGYSQTIVPHDSGRGSDKENRDIIDDVIYLKML